MIIKLRTKERTIKMRGEKASLSPKQRHRKAMIRRAVREKAAQAAPSKQPEQSSVEAAAVDQMQQMGEFTVRKAAYIAHEKRKLRKQRRSKTAQTDHTDNGTSNNAAQSTGANYRPIHTAEAAEGKPSAVSRNEVGMHKVPPTETSTTTSSAPHTQAIKEFRRETVAPKTYKSTADAIPKARPVGMKRVASTKQSTPRQTLRQQAVRQQARKSAVIQSAKAATQTNKSPAGAAACKGSCPGSG